MSWVCNLVEKEWLLHYKNGCRKAYTSYLGDFQGSVLLIQENGLKLFKRFKIPIKICVYKRIHSDKISLSQGSIVVDGLFEGYKTRDLIDSYKTCHSVFNCIQRVKVILKS